jgi:putative transposase
VLATDRRRSDGCGVEYDDNYRAYGARKMWLHLRGTGIGVARCTVERLMRDQGLYGARRGKAKRTTIADPAASRAKDLVRRNFRPLAPNLLWVADFTYVSTQSGWVYVAFVIDAYARRTLVWKVSASMTTDLVLDAINQAIFTRRREGVKDFTGLIHHNDAGSQGGFNRSSQHRCLPPRVVRSSLRRMSCIRVSCGVVR